jgi:predicted LPLAT superfamily acyltransferase
MYAEERLKREHWSEQKERAASWQMRLFFVLVRWLPPLLLKLAAFPVGLCFFIFAGKARAESGRFLNRAANACGKSRRQFSSLKNIISFALTLVEKADAWTGRVYFERIHFQNDDVGRLLRELEAGKGAVLLCSHLGNMELLRALADYSRTGVSREIAVTSVADFGVTPFFNKMVESLNPRSQLRIIDAGEIDPDTVLLLEEQALAGGLTVIAGDRTSANTRNQVFSIPFLGAPAPFPRGAFVLASLLGVPVYAVFGLRRRELSIFPEYNMYVYFIGSPDQTFSRRERKGTVESYARHFASLLEGYCLQYPHQWYNFYDYWAGGGDGSPQHHLGD